jgi:hypothetical protein
LALEFVVCHFVTSLPHSDDILHWTIRVPIAEMNNEFAGMAESVGYDVCDDGERPRVSVGGILFVNDKR